MKKIAFVIMTILMALAIFTTQPVTAYSPRHCKGLDIYFYENPDQGWAALVAAEVDFFQWSLTFEQYTAATLDPTIQVAGYAENGMMEFDLNNNYTIADFPGVRSPMNDVNFRRALAFATDKDWITTVVCMGFGVRIDVPICAPQMGYANESVIGPNYPYKYSMIDAADTLTAAGFEDIDDDGVLNYPADWDGRPGRPEMDPVKVCIRSDHGHRLAAGRKLADNMRALDIPVNQVEASSDVLFPMVMDDFNYHIYTGGWSFGRYPTYLHGLFHNINYISGGSNYITGTDKNGDPNYPDLDEALEGVLYATSTAGFAAACKKASGLIVADYCINIPLWSYSSWWGYRKNVVGIVNMDGSGLENTYTFLNAYKVDDPATGPDESQDPLRMGTVHAPKDLNVLYSTWYYDYAVMDRIFSGLIAVEPYNLAADNPWIAQDWEEGEWFDFQEEDDPETPDDDERIKTVITYWIRKDVYFHAPLTGEAVRQLNASDVEFWIWYAYAFDDSWIWGSFMDIHHTEIIDEFQIKVYFNLKSMWFKYFPTGPALPKYEYLDLLCTETCVPIPITENIDPEDPLGKIIFTEDQVIQVINCTSVNEGPLVEGVHFEIFATGPTDYCHNEIHFLIPLTAGDVVTICFWTPDADPHGYYLAGLDWSETFYSTGPYYPIEIIKGVGGQAIMNCTDSHFIGAPPLGEIDWKWTWTGTVKPRSGYFQVFLYDAVKLLGGYCSRGDAVPDLNWFPGADIDPTDLCHVGLYDAVTVLGKYGQKFGSPPP